MDKSLQIELLEELQGLKKNDLFFLDDSQQPSPVSRYADPHVFASETREIFQRAPQVAAHSSELPEPGSFLTMTMGQRPVLLTRDSDGAVRAFLNVCRHRGTQLVGEASGCKNAFTCPYHAWTWNNRGELRGIPYEEQGFPGIDRAAYGLKTLPATERLGLIWVAPDPNATPDFDAHIEPLAQDFAWLDIAGMCVAHADVFVRRANWKLLSEGGLEAYHFKVTHRNTIGPHFPPNLSSYARLGSHIRSVMPRNSLLELSDLPQDAWHIREHANVLYTVFPSNQFLALQDHVGWITLRPLAHDRTEVTLRTMVPRSDNTEEKAAHWANNHNITSVTLDEDFAVNEAAQAGMDSGANDSLTFGRYEGALNAFNVEVEKWLGRRENGSNARPT